MKTNESWKEIIRNIVKSRAAVTITTVTAVFVCIFTMFEFTALELEIEVPVLKALTSGSDRIWIEEYREGEQAMDDSRENEILQSGEQADGENIKGSEPQNSLIEDAVSAESGTEEEFAPTAEKDEPSAEEKAESDAVEKDEPKIEEKGTPDAVTKDGPSTGEERAAEAEFPYYIRVNRKQNCITIYLIDENGEYSVPYKAMICSTGLYNATPCGTFHLSTKYLWRELYGGVYGQYATRITGGVLFHSVPYYKKNKTTLCTDKYNKLGQQASMGCIRLTVEDAKWIAENCPSGTTVEIYDDDDPGPLGKPQADKIDTDNPNKGWDPTDPDEENPWHGLSDDA